MNWFQEYITEYKSYIKRSRKSLPRPTYYPQAAEEAIRQTRETGRQLGYIEGGKFMQEKNKNALTWFEHRAFEIFTTQPLGIHLIEPFINGFIQALRENDGRTFEEIYRLHAQQDMGESEGSSEEES